jgi:hypothetical protein
LWRRQPGTTSALAEKLDLSSTVFTSGKDSQSLAPDRRASNHLEAKQFPLERGEPKEARLPMEKPPKTSRTLHQDHDHQRHHRNPVPKLPNEDTPMKKRRKGLSRVVPQQGLQEGNCARGVVLVVASHADKGFPQHHTPAPTYLSRHQDPVSRDHQDPRLAGARRHQDLEQ